MKKVGLRNELSQLIGSIGGIGVLGASAKFAPAFAMVGIPAFLVYQGGKYVLGPQFRTLVGIALQKVGNTLSKEEHRVLTGLLSTEGVIQQTGQIKYK